MSAEPISDAEARAQRDARHIFERMSLTAINDVAVAQAARIRALEAEVEDQRDGLKECARIRKELTALKAEVARKDAALRPFALIAEHDIGKTEADTDLYRPMQPQNARAPLPTVGDLRAAAAALGPWVPTHQRQHGDFVREVARGRHAEDAGAMVAFDKADGSLWFLAAYYFDGDMKAFDKDGMLLPPVRRYRPRTTDEARAAVEGRS